MFLQCTDNQSDDIIQASLKVEKYIENTKLLKKAQQTKITYKLFKNE